jgi:DNA-binding protein HU-beta
MNKRELVDAIAQDAGLSKVDAENALNSFVSCVTAALAGGSNVQLIGFGTFSISARAARPGRNPKTGAAIQIEAKKVAKFKAGKALSESVI